jgi:HSP20 family molecular chaperone IbpA
VDEDKGSKNGVLTVTLPNIAPAQSKVKRITIKGK